jgi:hypothetical protein
MPPPKQKPVAATFFPREPAAKLRHARLHVRHEARRWSGAERSHGFELVGERPRTALLGQQVDRQRRVATGREVPRDRTDRVVEPPVLVDHQYATASPACRRPGAHQPATPWPAKRDLAGLTRGDLDLRRLRFARRSGAWRSSRQGLGMLHHGSCEQGRSRGSVQPEQPQPTQRLAP